MSTSENKPAPLSVVSPDPEVSAKPKRRKFSAAFKLRILREVEELKGTGEIGAFLRSEGLYHAQLTHWRQLLAEGGPEALEPKKRGRAPKPQEQKENESQMRQLKRENEALRKKLAQAEAIIDVQKKVAALLSMTPTPGNSE